MAIEFRLLGQVEALLEGRQLVLGSARPRAVLAALLLDANRIVTLDDLIGRVWGEDAPHQPRSSIHSYFTRLRSALDGASTIVRRGQGYVLETDAACIDLHRFREAAVRARRAADTAEAVRHFDTALSLWRGTPFSGLDSPWLTAVRITLEAERESIVFDRTERRLELGQHTQLVAELGHRTSESPLDERLAAQLMLALYRSGRQADALLHFQQMKTTLADELGIDPGPALRALYQSILEGDPRLALPKPTARTVLRSDEQDPIVPRQLPAAPQSFVGRENELAILSAILTPEVDAVPSVLIAAAGGMGKTSLALQWAHQHADLFPDGQLFVDLRGFEPSVDRIPPEHAMRSVLLAFQLGSQTIPDNPEALTGLYRSALADKRLLLVIDNARDADQVAALMPGSRNCAVLVTSRNRLTSLTTSFQSHLLPLDVLSVAEANALLTARLGSHRSVEEVSALGELTTACGGLPLALGILVGRAQEHPEFPLSALVAELHEAGSALSALDIDDGANIRTVLSTSCAALSLEQAEAFWLLGLAPGSDIGLRAASTLFGRSFAATRRVLRELERTSLVHQHIPGRFRMHDLVRLYAREQAEERLSQDIRQAILRRLAEFYTRTMVLATEAFEPARPEIKIGPVPEGVAPLPIRGAEEAWQWFDDESQNIEAIRAVAERFGWHDLIWLIPTATSTFYGFQGRACETFDSWLAAIASAEQVGDLDRVSLAHRKVARLAARADQQNEAVAHILASLRAAEESGSVLEQILTLDAMTEVHARMGRLDLAIGEGLRAWDLARSQSEQLRSRLAGNLAWSFAMDGQYDRGRQFADTALKLDSTGDDSTWTMLGILGYISLHQGRLDEAVGHLRDAQELCPASDVFTLADILCWLGETCVALGRDSEGREHLQRALHLYRGQRRVMEERGAEEILDRLGDRRKCLTAPSDRSDDDTDLFAQLRSQR